MGGKNPVPADISLRGALPWGQVAAGRAQPPCCGDTGPAQRWSPGRCGCGLGLRARGPRAGRSAVDELPSWLQRAGAGPPATGSSSEGWSVPTRITGPESASGCSRGCRTGALPGAAPCPLPEGSGGNCAHPTPHHPATRARSLSSRPCFGTSHQTPHPCAPPLCHLPRADWTSRFSARRPTAWGR